MEQLRDLDQRKDLDGLGLLEEKVHFEVKKGPQKAKDPLRTIGHQLCHPE